MAGGGGGRGVGVTRHIDGLVREAEFEARHTPAVSRKLAVPD